MTEPDAHRLRHILDQIDRIFKYTADGRSAFDGDEMIQDAVLQCLTVIGEAPGTLSETVYAGLVSLPPHVPKRMRNRLVHECWRIDPDMVWATIERDLPVLRGRSCRSAPVNVSAQCSCGDLHTNQLIIDFADTLDVLTLAEV